MDFLLNDCSLHGQYHEATAFNAALEVIMRMRHAAKQHGCEVWCHHGLLEAQTGPSRSFRQVLQTLSREQRGAFLLWTTQQGPFWDELRQHGPDEWLEHAGQIVTDRALGEAAFMRHQGFGREVLSFAPSSFEASPLLVNWVLPQQQLAIAVPNHWQLEPFVERLRSAPPALRSWSELAQAAPLRFDALTFAADAFEPLLAHPFGLGAAERILFILAVLQQMRGCFDADGARTPEGHRLYRDFFTGKKGAGGRGALFSDSSDDEKTRFAAELNFAHPERKGEKLFATWHGKVQTPQLRVHFSWPMSAITPTYILYVGPKLTKR